MKSKIYKNRDFYSSRKDYFKRHYKILMLTKGYDVSKKVNEVLAEFLCLPKEINDKPFSTKGRKHVRMKLNISSQGLSKYLSDLIGMEVLEKEGKDISFNKEFLPNSAIIGYMHQIVYKRDENNT